MKAVIQRVSSASVSIDGEKTAKINSGLMVLLGVSINDTVEDAKKIADKMVGLRIFSDKDDKMNLSVLQTQGEILVVSNFTLYADCKKGRRPSFINAGRPEMAEGLYETFMILLKDAGVREVKQGVFGADMQLSIENDGPVTIILDSEELR